jgi:arylsulfatase A-like enzyme
MYGPDDILPANRQEAEKDNPHPVVKAFMGHEESLNFSIDSKRRHVIPAYMGLITEIDDHIGRLMTFLEDAGRLEDTLIVFTSDHGDYLGDHWLGEKELFHEESVKIPLIIRDPRKAADGTRGHIEDRLVEAIDLIPTFVDVLGGEPCPHLLEGRSLAPLLAGDAPEEWRDYVVSEVDYAWRGARLTLHLPPDQTRGYMLRDRRWKYISYDNFDAQLFDLADDPQEFTDLGQSPAHAEIRAEWEGRLNGWLRLRRNRTTMSHEEIEKRTDSAKTRGIYFGVW